MHFNFSKDIEDLLTEILQINDDFVFEMSLIICSDVSKPLQFRFMIYNEEWVGKIDLFSPKSSFERITPLSHSFYICTQVYDDTLILNWLTDTKKDIDRINMTYAQSTQKIRQRRKHKINDDGSRKDS